jgi:hypothetical protein
LDNETTRDGILANTRRTKKVYGEPQQVEKDADKEHISQHPNA